MNTQTINVDLTQLNNVATEIANNLQGGEVLALSGDLGAGKTTFVQFLAKALGITEPVTSPTFAIEKQYPTVKGFTLHHFDWYRLATAGEVEGLGVTDLWDQSVSSGDRTSVVTVIEWPERAEQLLPAWTTRIHIDNVDATTRRLIINY